MLALKGRHKRMRTRDVADCFALSGLTDLAVFDPRALPWADMFWPLRGRELGRRRRKSLFKSEICLNLVPLDTGSVGRLQFV